MPQSLMRLISSTSLTLRLDAARGVDESSDNSRQYDERLHVATGAAALPQLTLAPLKVLSLTDTLDAPSSRFGGTKFADAEEPTLGA